MSNSHGFCLRKLFAFNTLSTVLKLRTLWFLLEFVARMVVLRRFTPRPCYIGLEAARNLGGVWKRHHKR